MAAIPTLEDEDARWPSRERESLIKECTRIVNRVKANLARLGIRGFRPSPGLRRRGNSIPCAHRRALPY
jgi:transposase